MGIAGEHRRGNGYQFHDPKGADSSKSGFALNKQDADEAAVIAV
jgi:hypothetical protein